MPTTNQILHTCYNQEIPACAAVRLIAQAGVITSVAVVRDALRNIALTNNHNYPTTH